MASKTPKLSMSDAPIPEAVRAIIKEQCKKMAKALAGSMAPPTWAPKEFIDCFIPPKIAAALQNGAKLMDPDSYPDLQIKDVTFASSVDARYIHAAAFHWDGMQCPKMLFPPTLSLQETHTNAAPVAAMQTYVDHCYKQAVDAGETLALISAVNGCCDHVRQVKHIWPALPLLVTMANEMSITTPVRGWLDRFEDAKPPRDAPDLWPGWAEDIARADAMVAVYGVAPPPAELDEASVPYRSVPMYNGQPQSDVIKRFMHSRERQYMDALHLELFV